MQLWTDYEGVTIDGAIPLQKLLMPEGRSAFFSTAGAGGEPTVVRLIECHFDEEEILTRWRSIDALGHPNFVRFEHIGQTELDGRPVVYAVFEKVDANLAEVLDQGSLPLPDVEQLASSLVAALDALHPLGFIHGHIEPRNIFAVGSAVKLRSDCISEAPEGEEGRVAKQRDVHDLAAVLLQALTQKQSIEGVPNSALPGPFSQIIRNGLDGTWGLDAIKFALERHLAAQQTRPPRPVSAPPSASAAAAPNLEPAAAAAPKPATLAAEPLLQREAQLPLPLLDEARIADIARVPTRRDTGVEDRSSPSPRWLIGAGFALLVVVFFWTLAHVWNTHRDQIAHTGAQTASVSRPAPPISTNAVPAPRTANPPRTIVQQAAASHPGWRVIAFTYNRRADAEKKAASLASKHPELQPTVFTATGHAPYLVSIGGIMDQTAAHTLARRSRSLGLPHDTYAQNYNH